MVRSKMKILWQMFKVFILFTGCTTLFYYGMIWINQEYENYHRYEEPEGSAVKVYQSLNEDPPNWVDRLLLFYLDGE
ncbi:hypothetical protein J2S13_000155 [Oikeobacillus pervagus]|uniref:DUF4227 family protein n=2 Tax=Oikeobacillus pervagus TaxID=1325931 RepID=A0AAJ1SYN8_9BACI|nr:hypothetical protein [Oikeobacillus pervagus]